MPIKKDLFINSLKLVEVNGRLNIPTAILFNPGFTSIGYEARETATDLTDINENFKLELGKISPGRVEPPRFESADGKQRSANEITREFINLILEKTDDWIRTQGLKKASRILVAEPLSLDKSALAGQDWLANYRQRLKAILIAKFREVDFLPEPFAVFQYYRYGIKHPLVASSTKHIALVIDFGGGTFDVSVVETAASGDVSASGRNSKPLAAASHPTGGHAINIEIALSLIKENISKNVNGADLAKAHKEYENLAAGRSGDFSSLRDDFKNYIRNMRRLVAELERVKISICNTISDWRLDAEYQPCPAYQIPVPANPFAFNPEKIDVRLDAYKLRDIFVNRIWKKILKSAISDALSRADSELEGRQINVILLSGGSSNIRWLGQLIKYDLSHKLPHAEILELQESFQEVVAKGLAIECARRTYNEGISDFKTITYNRLCLVLGVDGNHPRPPNFKRVDTTYEVLDEGVLLPSASIIGKFIGKPLRWKTTLPSPPKQRLDYYFLKSSLDFNDLTSLQNIEHRLFTPADTRFDPSIHIELTISEDGTAQPRFIYRQGRGTDSGVVVDGIPFFMDMTSGIPTTTGDAYIGFDFGSSNSAVSYVEQGAVRIFTQRSGDSGWLELNELVNVLPYPIASPLGRFLAGTTEHHLEVEFGKTFEALLLFGAFVAYSEYRTVKNSKETKIFKEFTKSSVGPLWAMLRKCLVSTGERGPINKGLSKLLQEKNQKIINDAIEGINDKKHHREAHQMDYKNVLNAIGNIVAKAIIGWDFGRFEAVTKKGFSGGNVGLFRVAKGQHSPFLEILDFSGDESFSELEAIMINREEGVALRIAPLLFWTIRDKQGETDLAILDKTDGLDLSYKTVRPGSAIIVNSSSPFSDLVDMSRPLREFDLLYPEGRIVDLKFSVRQN
ncbi:MAG: hypothetical protein ABJA60_01235 [Nitrosospira sp.]